MLSGPYLLQTYWRNVYQLYMVLYQCASILISQSQGMEDITVKAKTTRNKAAHTVLVQIYFFPSSFDGNGFSSSLRERCLIFQPRNDHKTMVNTVTTVKKPLFKNPDLNCRVWHHVCYMIVHRSSDKFHGYRQK